MFDHLDMNGVKVDANKPFFVGGEKKLYIQATLMECRETL